MSKIIPFKAVRPSPDKVGLVSCRMYDDYSPAELAAWLSFNPYSFLHVVNPAYANAQRVTSDKRFKAVTLKYNDFKNDKILIQEEKAVFYLYEIKSKTNVFTGIIAGTSIEDYQNNVIKKHEDTLQYRVELFKDYLQQTGFNTEPVLITYPDSTEINTFITIHKKKKPIYEFSTTNKEKHTLWKIDTETEMNFLIEHFAIIPNLYIADGHHRSASAEMLYEQNKASGNQNLNYFMSFLIAESNLKIYEFNRVIRDLNGHSKENFVKLVAENFVITDKQSELYQPKNKFEFGMYLNEKFYLLEYKNKNFLPVAELSEENVLKNLDAQILYDTILNPILGITDLRNDERIDYLPGKQSVLHMKERIDENEFKVGFILYPSDINEIKLLADSNLIMPPKSTYIEPKLRSGLLIYEL